MVGAERLLVQQVELGQELQEPCLRAHDVQQEGRQLIDSGHFMSLEVGAQKGWSPTAQGLGTPSRNLSPQEKAGKEQRERPRREGEGLGLPWSPLLAPPGLLCLSASSGASDPEHPFPPGGSVSAGARRAAAGTHGGLHPAPGALRGELGPAKATAGAGPGRGLAGLPGGSTAGPQLWGEPSPSTPLASYTDWQLWPRAGPAVPQLPTR